MKDLKRNHNTILYGYEEIIHHKVKIVDILVSLIPFKFEEFVSRAIY